MQSGFTAYPYLVDIGRESVFFLIQGGKMHAFSPFFSISLNQVSKQKIKRHLCS